MSRARLPGVSIGPLAICLFLLGPRTVHSQIPTIRGYYLNVPTWGDSTDYSVGGLADFNRLRLMTEPALGPVTLQVAYEQVLSVSQRARLVSPGFGFVTVVPGGGEWLDLQWTIEDTDHVDWRHRFDRLNLRYAPGIFDFVLGRQAISWATTLFLTPADPFVPFDPSDPFREFRAGVDAFRMQLFPGPLSDLDLVVRPTKNETLAGEEENLTAAVRGRTVFGGWEVSAWAGALYNDPVFSVGAAGGVGAVALRSEAQVTGDPDSLVFRATVGLDFRLDVFARDLYLVFEYQHDGYGAAGASELVDVLTSVPFARGQLQVLGRDETVAQASYQLHPLWNAALLAIWNLNDLSLLLSPSAAYSITSDIAASGGLFLGVGDGTPDTPDELPSEYGIVPTSVYLSLTVFF